MKRFVALFVLLGMASSMVLAQEKTGTTTGGPLTVENCKYGPDTCQKPYVWREASRKDHVCVTPQVRKQTADQNAQAASHKSPNGGAYGKDTCKQGYVWREAFEGDHVCVAAQVRDQAAEDNKMAKSRKACHK